MLCKITFNFVVAELRLNSSLEASLVSDMLYNNIQTKCDRKHLFLLVAKVHT